MTLTAFLPVIWLFLGAFLLFPTSGKAQKERPKYLEVPCSHYWVGRMVHTFDPYTGIEIRRKRRKQKEFNPKTGEKTKWKVEWIDDCEYHLTFKKSNMPTKMRKGWVKKVQIVDCFKAFYNWDAEINGINYFGTIERMLSPRQQRRKLKREMKEREEFIRDSTQMAIEDSIAIANGANADSIAQLRQEQRTQQLAEKREREMLESMTKSERKEYLRNQKEARKAEESGENTETEASDSLNTADPENETEPGENSGEEVNEGEDENSENEASEPSGKRGKKDKKKKEKKKKEKKTRTKKEKKEKPPKEKKEKPPKEKKEKPPREKNKDKNEEEPLEDDN